MAEPGRSLCAEHQAEQERQRPQPSQSSRAIHTQGRDYHRYRQRQITAIKRGQVVTCHICGERITNLNGSEPDGLVIDHDTPVAQGGTTDASNLRPAHRKCNARKAGGVRAYQVRVPHPSQRQRAR